MFISYLAEIGGGGGRLYANLLITFLLGGLWHGAGWTFIFWGFLHALALIIHRLWQKLNIKLNKILAWFITFNFINIAWIFFRANEWQDAIRVLKGMMGFGSIIYYEKFNMLLMYNIVGIFIVIFIKNSNEISIKNKNLILFITIFLISFSLLQMFYFIIETNKVSEFLYFNF